MRLNKTAPSRVFSSLSMVSQKKFYNKKVPPEMAGLFQKGFDHF